VCKVTAEVSYGSEFVVLEPVTFEEETRTLQLDRVQSNLAYPKQFLQQVRAWLSMAGGPARSSLSPAPESCWVPGEGGGSTCGMPCAGPQRASTRPQ